MILSKRLDTGYKSLSDDETPQTQRRGRINQTLRELMLSNVTHVIIVALELLLFAFLVVGFVILSQARQSTYGKPELDGLSRLGEYNTTREFSNHSHLLLGDSDEANGYWRHLIESGGVVSLDTEWALDQGLRASHQSPTDPSQSIYQIDVFHALHCLVSDSLILSQLLTRMQACSHPGDTEQSSCEPHEQRTSRL